MPNEKHEWDNHSNQLNPNNDAYYQSRGYDDKSDYDDQNSNNDYDDDDWDDDYFAEPGEDEWDPNEENYEYEDIPGDNEDEREEYYDNIDWDARD